MNRNCILNYLFAVVLISACKNNEKPVQGPPPAINVSVIDVKRQDITGMDTYPANVVPLRQVELRAEVSGYITGIFVTDGQSVRQSQRLYEIDRSRYSAAYAQAEAQVEIARANLQKVSKDLERYTRLAEQDAIARQRLDYAAADRATANSQVTAAEANLQNAATDLRRSTIIAPFAGTIGISEVRQGTLVSAGSTLINTISSPDPIAVEFSIGEHEIERYVKLQREPGKQSDSLFTIEIPGGEVYRLNGKVAAIDRAVDPQTGTIKVRVSFANPNNILRAGMSCTMRVLNQDTGQMIAIPNKSVTEQLGEFYVYVLTDSSTVTQRRITSGSRSGANLVIREGLQEGETIVVDGVQNLREGVKVKAEKVQGTGI